MHNLFYQMGMQLALSAQKVTLTDAEALQVKSLQKAWRPGEAVETGERRQYQGLLYKCRQAHTTQEDWTPDAYPAGWEVIDEVHAGTKEDPVPYTPGMALEKNKYYRENQVLYVCIRDTEQAVYQSLIDLAGIYVEAV